MYFTGHAASNVKFNQKEESNIYLPFSTSYYSPKVQVQNSQFYLSALSPFAGSGSGTIIPDPGKSSGSMRIRIRNTAKNSQSFYLTDKMTSLSNRKTKNYSFSTQRATSTRYRYLWSCDLSRSVSCWCSSTFDSGTAAGRRSGRDCRCSEAVACRLGTAAETVVGGGGG